SARCDFRGVRAGRRRQHAGVWRHRAGPHHRAPPCTANGRRDCRGKRARQRLNIHADAAASLRRVGGTPRLKTILVVEDVELNRDLLAQLLEDKYRLVFAANGVAALERAAATKPDLILKDLSLPRMDGWESARRLKADS